MQAKNSRTKLAEPPENIDDAVKECVRYILCREGSKILIKRSEIRDHLSTTCQSTSSEINAIILQSEKMLKKIYGFKLVQIPSKPEIKYMVVLAEPCENSLLSTTIDVHQRQLLVAALTHIFMSGGTVKDDNMWDFLDEAGLLKQTDNAGRKILTNLFTKQSYLKYSKIGEALECMIALMKVEEAKKVCMAYGILISICPNRKEVGETEVARYMFEWGQRAIDEIPKLFLLNKMAKAFDKEPCDWAEQYKNCTRSD